MVKRKRKTQRKKRVKKMKGGSGKKPTTMKARFKELRTVSPGRESGAALRAAATSGTPVHVSTGERTSSPGRRVGTSAAGSPVRRVGTSAAFSPGRRVGTSVAGSPGRRVGVNRTTHARGAVANRTTGSSPARRAQRLVRNKRPATPAPKRGAKSQSNSGQRPMGKQLRAASGAANTNLEKLTTKEPLKIYGVDGIMKQELDRGVEINIFKSPETTIKIDRRGQTMCVEICPGGNDERQGDYVVIDPDLITAGWSKVSAGPARGKMSSRRSATPLRAAAAGRSSHAPVHGRMLSKRSTTPLRAASALRGSHAPVHGRVLSKSATPLRAAAAGKGSHAPARGKMSSRRSASPQRASCFGRGSHASMRSKMSSRGSASGSPPLGSWPPTPLSLTYRLPKWSDSSEIVSLMLKNPLGNLCRGDGELGDGSIQHTPLFCQEVAYILQSQFSYFLMEDLEGLGPAELAARALQAGASQPEVDACASNLGEFVQLVAKYECKLSIQVAGNALRPGGACGDGWGRGLPVSKPLFPYFYDTQDESLFNSILHGAKLLYDLSDPEINRLFVDLLGERAALDNIYPEEAKLHAFKRSRLRAGGGGQDMLGRPWGCVDPDAALVKDPSDYRDYPTFWRECESILQDIKRKGGDLEELKNKLSRGQQAEVEAELKSYRLKPPKSGIEALLNKLAADSLQGPDFTEPFPEEAYGSPEGMAKSEEYSKKYNFAFTLPDLVIGLPAGRYDNYYDGKGKERKGDGAPSSGNEALKTLTITDVVYVYGPNVDFNSKGKDGNHLTGTGTRSRIPYSEGKSSAATIKSKGKRRMVFDENEYLYFQDCVEMSYRATLMSMYERKVKFPILCFVSGGIYSGFQRNTRTGRRIRMSVGSTIIPKIIKEITVLNGGVPPFKNIFLCASHETS